MRVFSIINDLSLLDQSIRVQASQLLERASQENLVSFTITEIVSYHFIFRYPLHLGWLLIAIESNSS